mgnify:CR=1 FL=1
MTRRAALYARVAAPDQAGRALAQQLERLHACARQRGWVVGLGQIYRDEGVSGLRLDRPALSRLRAAVAHGDVDAIIATAPDRLARDGARLAQLIEEFDRAGVQVVFTNRG